MLPAKSLSLVASKRKPNEPIFCSRCTMFRIGRVLMLFNPYLQICTMVLSGDPHYFDFIVYYLLFGCVYMYVTLVHAGMQPWTSVVLLGNKADISDNLRQVSLEDGLIFARQNMCASFFETSAKTGYNIKEALSNALLKSEQGRLEYLSSPGNERTSFRLKDSPRSCSESSTCSC
mmetsp:Transcript_6671/g.10077  ORF Transcript_6671/g.10077 Transcript_6671/m.10077 type:complete len:175 (+) Transcript_6671:1604-2128(+)